MDLLKKQHDNSFPHPTHYLFIKLQIRPNVHMISLDSPSILYNPAIDRWAIDISYINCRMCYAKC